MAYQSYQSMPQFQNQFQNQMYVQQPYQQPVQGMYMDRLSQLQQNAQMQNNSFMNTQNFLPLGKIVESVDIVKATDIPMDGNMYYFPKADGTEVYMKRWLPNGTTEIVSYKPIVENIEEANTSRNEAIGADVTNLIQYLNDIQNDIKMLTDKVDRFSKPVKSNRKEVPENE